MMTCYDHDQVTRTPLKLWLKPCKAEDPEQRWFFTQYEVSDHDCHGRHGRHGPNGCHDLIIVIIVAIQMLVMIIMIVMPIFVSEQSWWNYRVIKRDLISL